MLYFEVFSYPVSVEELLDTCALPGTTAEGVQETLALLAENGLVARNGEWYSTSPRPDWAKARAENAERGKEYLDIARRIGPWIGAFPYVRAVFVSGSLSKGVMPADGDIDYFVVTQPGRLWVARTLLVMFKKIFLLNSKKYWCVNYFVDENHLRIEEQNRFTATEVVTLMPVYGSEWYKAFLRENDWAKAYYPHFPPRDVQKVPPHRSRGGKWLGEAFLGTGLGTWLDRRMMYSTVKYWVGKFENLSPDEFAIALKSQRHVSKHHPQHFQQRVLNRHAELMARYEAEKGVLF